MYQLLDTGAVMDMMIRWRLVEQQLVGESDDEEAAAMALQFLVKNDYPTLVGELFRLRPELEWPVDHHPAKLYREIGLIPNVANG